MGKQLIKIPSRRNRGRDTVTAGVAPLRTTAHRRKTQPVQPASKTRRPVARKRSRTPDEDASVPAILTIGHSTRPIAEFVALLKAHRVARVIDVRTVPRSRHNPQFNRENLPASLAAVGIGYRHRASLGGLRRPAADSPNKGWRNLSFRGYADYMQTPEFNTAVDELVDLAKKERLALMCAEAVPWRCHRSLIADALLVRGIRTADIGSVTRLLPHRLTPFAKVRRGKITYPTEARSASSRAAAPPSARR